MEALSDRTLSALRQQFGAETDAKIADARALIDQAASRWPDARRFIDCAGLADNPHLIASLAARVEHRRRGPAPRKRPYRPRRLWQEPADSYPSLLTASSVPARHPSRSMNGDSDGHY